MKDGKQVVVVAGASAEVLRETARAYADEGAKVVLLGVGKDELARSRGTLDGSEALVLPVDVADGEAVEFAKQTVERQLGPIDVWVNCALLAGFAPKS